MCCKPFPASSVLPAMKTQLNMLSPFFWGELAIASFLMSFLHIKLDRFLLIKPLKKKKVVTVQSSQQVQALTVEDKVSLLDLPELALDCILERLSPPGLCSMALVCSSMRDKCRSDYLWEKHMRDKWGRLIGDAAHGEWQCQVASTNRPRPCGQHERKGFIDFIFNKIWPFSWVSPSLERENEPKRSYSPPGGSVMALYLSLESGKFLFPAQVYNRENGHSGFMLSCYDALLSYDSATDTFQARYLSHGRRTVEENIPWHRLRAPPVATPPHKLHVSDCLNDLRPGDHVEIQWRKSKEFPYGWWYGIVGHLESCDGGDGCCGCHYNDNVVLEFNQYPAESRWRRTVVNRKQHREEGNEVNGFYGGIRKLYRNEEISVWKRLWPSRILE